MHVSPLAPVLFSRTRQAVLGLLYGRPNQAFYLRQIAHLTGLGIGQVQRELGQLSTAGVLRRDARGRHVYFQADPSCPIFDELRGIVTKTLGGAAVLSNALEPLRGRIAIAFIHGSVARREEHATSDLDLLVIGDVTLGDMVEVVRNSEARLRRPIHPIVYPVHELRAKLAAGNHFLRTVIQGEKVFVVGDENELGTLLA